MIFIQNINIINWYISILSLFDTYLSNAYGYNNIQHIQQQLESTNNNTGIVYYVENARPFETNSYTNTYFFFKLIFLSNFYSAYNPTILIICTLNYAVSHALIIYTLSQGHHPKITSTSNTGHTQKTPHFCVCPTESTRYQYQASIACK